MLGLKELSMAELQDLKKKVETEIASRAGVKEEKVVYKNECHGSSNYHYSKNRHYTRLVTAVDTTKTNCYAFLGTFLSASKEELVPVNSYIIESCSGYNYTLYQVTSEEKVELLSGSRAEMATFINGVAKIVNQ